MATRPASPALRYIRNLAAAAYGRNLSRETVRAALVSFTAGFGAAFRLHLLKK